MLYYLIIEFLLLCLSTSNCYPIEEPTKFMLNVKETTVKNIQPPSKLEQAQEVLAQIGDAIRIGRGRFVNAITLARNNIAYLPEIITANNVALAINEKSKLLDDGTKSLESLTYPPSIFFDTTSRRETVHLENESEQSLVEKTLTLPFNDLLVNFFKPKPLIDQIKEEDKYGNTGEKMNNIGRAFINGYESFSNFLNSAIGSTTKLKKTVGSSITDALNQIGGKLIGLQ